MSIVTENFDGVTAPSASISGWTVGANIVTSTTVKVSGANSLANVTSTGSNTTYFATWNTPDGTSGNVKAVVKAYLTVISADSSVALTVRASSSTLTTSDTYYAAIFKQREIGSGSGRFVVEIEKVVAGVRTLLANKTVLISAVGGWYQIEFEANGTALAMNLIRTTDGNYLNSSGSFTATVANCLTATDSSITGAGYAGIYFFQASGTASPVYADDYELNVYGGGSSVTVTVSALASVGVISSGNSLSAGSNIAVGSLIGAGTLGDNPVAADPLAATGVLSPVNILNPPNVTTNVLPLIATGVIPNVVVGGGTTVSVSPLIAAGVLPNVATAAGGSVTISVSPLVGQGGLGVVNTFIGATSDLVYTIYANDGAGGPIDYDNAIDSTQDLTWTSDALAYAGEWRFGVRVSSLTTGLQEKNIDAATTLILDAAGVDITRRPKAPVAVRVFPLAGGTCRVEWAYPYSDTLTRPTGFRVFIGSPSTVDYGAVVATKAYSGSGSYAVDLDGFTDATTYVVGVRAYNATAEEPNTLSVSFVADATGPTAVTSLTATAV